jgi:hypothetical protein
MSERLVDRIPFAKIFTVLAIVLGISLGLCGVTAVLSSGDYIGGSFLNGLGILMAAGILLSAAGLALTALVVVTLLIFGIFSEKVSQPVKLFDKENDTKIDRNE